MIYIKFSNRQNKCMLIGAGVVSIRHCRMVTAVRWVLCRSELDIGGSLQVWLVWKHSVLYTMGLYCLLHISVKMIGKDHVLKIRSSMVGSEMCAVHLKYSTRWKNKFIRSKRACAGNPVQLKTGFLWQFFQWSWCKPKGHAQLNLRNFNRRKKYGGNSR